MRSAGPLFDDAQSRRAGGRFEAGGFLAAGIGDKGEAAGLQRAGDHVGERRGMV